MDDREAVNLSAKFDWETGAGTLTSITSYDSLDHVTAAEQFAYYPFVQVQGTPGAAASRRRRGAGVRRDARRLRHRPEPHVRPEPLPRLVQSGAAHHLARRSAFALDRRRLLRADRPRRDDLDQQRFRPGLRRAAHGPNIGGINPTVTWSQRFLAPLIPIIGFPAASASEPEHESERARLQLRQQPQHGVCAVRADQLRLQRHARALRRAALRPRRARAHDHGAGPVPAGVRVPERPPGRRARGRVRFRAAEAHAELAAERGLDALRHVCRRGSAAAAST